MTLLETLIIHVNELALLIVALSSIEPVANLLTIRSLSRPFLRSFGLRFSFSFTLWVPVACILIVVLWVSPFRIQGQRSNEMPLFCFFRPTPCGFRQVVQQLSKPVAHEINYLIRAGAAAVVAAKVNWKRTDT